MSKYVYAVRDGGWVGKLGRANVAPVLRPRANEWNEIVDEDFDCGQKVQGAK